MLEDKDDVDIFDEIVEDKSKVKKIRNKKYRETERDMFEILDVNKMSKQLGFKLNLEKICQIIEESIKNVKCPEDITLFKAVNDNEIDKNEFNDFNINPENEIKEACKEDGEKINLYKVNLKRGENIIGFTNIIYYENKNKTLPLGMDFSTKAIIDLSKLNRTMKKTKKFHIARFKDEKDDFSNIITKDVIVYEE